jgi:hypothetical protein
VERLRTPYDWCRVCGGQEWHRSRCPDTGNARLACVGCGYVRKWPPYRLAVDFIRHDPDEALPGQVAVVVA